MPRLVLHIGMSKTGSTSIETTFDASRPILERHGIDYLDMGQNHSRLMTVVATNKVEPLKGDVTRILGIERRDTNYDAATVIAAVRERLQSPRAPTVVISGQGLFRYGREKCAALRDFVRPHFDEVRVVAYLRDPTSWASSRAQELMKRGITQDQLARELEERPADAQLLPHYRASAEAYCEAFGRENVDLRLFDRKVFVNGDLLADFCAAIGAEPGLAEALHGSFSNRGAPTEALLLLQAHYDIVEDRLRAAEGAPPRAAAPSLDALTEAAERYRHPSSSFPIRQAIRNIRGTRWSLPKPMLDTIWRHSMDDIEWLRRHLGQPDLFAAAYPPAEAPAPAWSTETLQDLARALEEALGDVMVPENRRTRIPAPLRGAQKYWHRVKRLFRRSGPRRG
ncbi:hypothetical protein [Prosthecodimorpha staleyi]|uniref:Uncharacterized protein n=1 Tax=Prosthecodimorpha staleyi TaxID=2840188 RepID=A0A947D8D8_9HYPH|nr:hypothetical protein [Prosthecodimorpha staleyi]MBT9289927.1 hypothetical protein [Prosthecodimorpha staleyi]